MASPPGASPLLPQARHGAREADRKRAVEKPDVDPELERVRRRHAEEVALDKPTLDVSPLRRRVARAVGREARGQLRPHTLGGEPVDQLRRLPRLRETDRPQAALDEVGEELRAFPERAGAELELLVEERRVPEGDCPSCVWRGVLSDHRRLDAEQGLDELARVGDRGRREEELRLRSVDRRGAAKASQDVRDVRPEDAAVDVRLVHDHVTEVLEDVSPAVVVREDPDVEHVRVREDDVGPLADLPAPLGLGVAVVDRRAQARKLEGRERTSLVLRQGLRGIEVEGPELRLLRERVQHGQIEGQRLAARGPGGDDEVLAPLGRVEGFRLVAVEAVEAEACERVEDAGMQPVRNGDDVGPPGRDLGAVRELLALEELVPGHDRHRGDASLIARGTQVPHDCGLGLRRRRGHPGRPEGLRRARLPRHERDRGADGAVDDRGALGARGSARVHPRRARGRVRRHRRGRGEDGDAVLPADHRDRGGLPRRPPGAAGRRSRDGGRLRREASPGRRGRGARRAGCCRSPRW